MKNNSAILSVIIAAFFFTVSCEKEYEHPDTATPVSKVIEVTLDQNESYSYTIPPGGDADAEMEISQQAQHALTSKITRDGSRNTLFEYTPALDYTGSDEIHVSTAEDKQRDGNHGGNHHGNCQGGHDNETRATYIFKITVAGRTVSQVR